MQHNNYQKATIVLKILGNIIKEQRLNKQKSLRLLSDEFDLQKSMLSRIENGVSEAKIISVISICEALGIKTSDLLKMLEERLPKNFSLMDK